MTLFDSSPNRRWLFCFTHPDDEISICAWMRRLVKSGANVHCGWSVSNPVREAESRRVMDRLGVLQQHLSFLTYPDKGACDHLYELASDWARIVESAKPDVIAVGAFECGHIDHDSTNFAVRHALDSIGKSSVPMLEIPWYHTYLTRIPVLNRFADPTGEEVLELDVEEQKLKREVSRMYPSQNIASLLFWYTLLSWIKLKPVDLRKTERMRLQTHFDYTVPNLPDALNKKVRRSQTWNRWIRSVERFAERS
jgi:LmbE family N-acetylglucosaminyl deacetylase